MRYGALNTILQLLLWLFVLVIVGYFLKVYVVDFGTTAVPTGEGFLP